MRIRAERPAILLSSVAAVLLLVLGAVEDPGFAQSETEPEPALASKRTATDEIFAAYDRGDSPGCALGVARDGQFLYSRGYGMANLEYDIPIDGRTVFRIGSTSKQFAAFAILLLHEDGQLHLDDDVRKLIPELQPHDPPVRIRHLVHHTSGVRDYLTLMSLRGERDLDYYTDEEVVDILARQRELNFEPGSEFLYSNSGYFLLSVLVERASGSSLAEFAQQRIFEPLGMKNTHFHDDSTRIVKRRASGYAPSADGFTISQTTLPMVGDGGVFTTTEDLLLWVRSFTTKELGSEETRRLQLEAATLPDGESTGYAAGLMTRPYRGQPTIAHGGAFVGYRAELLQFPEQQLSISVLCNLSSTNPSRLARQVADVFLADVLEPPDGAEAEAAPSVEPAVDPATLQVATAPAGALERFVGTWQRGEQLWFVRKVRDTSDSGSNESWFVDTPFLGTLEADVVRLTGTADEQKFALRTIAPANALLQFVGDGNEQLRMHSLTFGFDFELQRATVKAISEEELAAVVGLYYSPELDVHYRIDLDSGQLWPHHEDRHRDFFEAPLQPTPTSDRLASGRLTFDLERNVEGDVTGFRLGAGRVKNLIFERVDG